MPRLKKNQRLKVLKEDDPEYQGGKLCVRSPSQCVLTFLLLPSQEAVRRGLAAPKQTAARRSVDIQAPPDGRRNVGIQVLQVGATAPLWFSSRFETFPDQP